METIVQIFYMAMAAMTTIGIWCIAIELEKLNKNK
jgi:hypothetical protein